MYETLKTCPLCGGDAYTLVLVAPDPLSSQLRSRLPDAIDIPETQNRLCRCDCCGVYFLNPRLDQASLANLYHHWYSNVFSKAWNDPDYRRLRLMNVERNYIPVLNAHSKSPGRLLDIGCGTGEFIQVSAEHGWDSSGLEWDDVASRKAHQLSGRPVFAGMLSDHSDSMACYDVITMFDYLEHSMTPGKDLDSAVKLLKPGGTIIVRVPNFGSWCSRLTKGSWGYLISNHLTLYTLPVLRSTLERRGLRIVQCNARGHRRFSDMARMRVKWIKDHLTARRHLPSKKISAETESTVAKPGRSRSWRALRAFLLELLDIFSGHFNRADIVTVVAVKSEYD